MTAQFRAKGLASVGHGMDDTLHLSTHITEGLKSAVGRYLTLSLDQHGLEFLFSTIAGYYPHVIMAMAAELEKYNFVKPLPPGHYDRNQFSRARDLREAIQAALESEANRPAAHP